MFAPLYLLTDAIRDHGRRRFSAPNHAAGRRGEDIAHRYLQRAGMTVVARNYRNATGTAEADLIAWDRDTLTLVEVKSRSTAEYGDPSRAIGDEKRRHMIRAAYDYARRSEVPLSRVRFDLVTVVFSTPPEVTHLRDVFSIRSSSPN